jgi:hypothetical protein
VKTVLALVVVIVIGVVVLGFYRGWFETGTKQDDGKQHVDLSVNTNKFKEDKENLKKTLAAKSKSLKDKLAGLTDKVKTLSGEAKAKAQKEIDALTKKHQQIESKTKQVDDVTEEKFDDLKKSVTDDLDDEAPGGKEGGTKPE